ncbi:MAG TPA: hypothetical protein VG324_12005 [Blastocatellia bacterium]|nr:hypothetical protein [Blastocatellia bacterium]
MKGLTSEDIIGEWSGSSSYTKPDGETKDEPIYLVLKPTDFAGTFRLNPNDQHAIKEYAIQEGKVEGDKITFEILTEYLFKIELTLVDGHLKGEAKAVHEGNWGTAAIDLQRKTD